MNFSVRSGWPDTRTRCITPTTAVHQDRKDAIQDVRTEFANEITTHETIGSEDSGGVASVRGSSS